MGFDCIAFPMNMFSRTFDRLHCEKFIPVILFWTNEKYSLKSTQYDIQINVVTNDSGQNNWNGFELECRLSELSFSLTNAVLADL